MYGVGPTYLIWDKRNVHCWGSHVLYIHQCFVVLPQVAPGETALAFYKAKNPTDDAITGISTYTVIPYEAGPYFNKIQVGQCVQVYLALILMLHLYLF